MEKDVFVDNGGEKCIDESKNETKANDSSSIYEYMVKFAELKYENEVKREEGIIHQASMMQSAFSFVMVAVLMVAAMACQYRGDISLEFFLLAFSTIALNLVICLFSATKALERRKVDAFLDVKDMNEFIIENMNMLQTENQRNKHYATFLGKVQKSIADNNEKRIRWLRFSLYSFYSSIGLCVVWFIVLIAKMC